MTDEDDVPSAIPLTVWPHRAALTAPQSRPAAYPTPAGLGGPMSADPAFVPWLPQARFAPPGPARTSLSMPGIVMLLAPAVLRLAPALPEALLDESAVLRRIADIAETYAPLAVDERPDVPDFEPEPAPSGLPAAYAATPLHSIVEFEDTTVPHDPGDSEQPMRSDRLAGEVGQDTDQRHIEPANPMAGSLAEQDRATPSVETPPSSGAAYWATAPDQFRSLDWTPPPIPETAAGSRPTPAMSGLWAAEPLDAMEDIGTLPRQRPARRVPTVAKIAAGLLLLVTACAVVVVALPRLLATASSPVATFNAPMMVLRAAVVGRVTNVAVTIGQTVEPSTRLFTIHTQPQPDPAASLLQDRLEAARGRLAALDDALTQPSPSTDAGRARRADLGRQRAAAATDVAQLQDGVANLPAKPPADQSVLAGVHGVIRTLEAQAGTPTQVGLPLVRMLDCDHAFLTLPPTTTLHDNEAVRVTLPNLPPVAAKVRKSVGIAEPPDSLVIAPAPGAFVGLLSGACPVGATANVTPGIAGS